MALSEVLEPLPGELGAYQPEFCYLLIDEGSLSRDRLDAMGNLVALLFRLETSAAAADAAAGTAPRPSIASDGRMKTSIPMLRSSRRDSARQPCRQDLSP